MACILKGGDWRLALGLLTLIWSLGAGASAISNFSGPLQFTDSGTIVPLDADGIYERQKYPRFGGEFIIRTLAGHNPADGDTWTISIHDSTLSTPLGTAFISYDGAWDCLLWVGTTPVFCGVHVPDDSNEVHTYTLKVRFGTLCLPEHDYALGALLADGIAPGSPWPFRPTQFEPQIEGIGYTPIIRPYLPADTFLTGHPLSAIEGGTSDIRTWVTDNLNCGEPLPDVQVKLLNRMTASDGHNHFTGDNEPPGGKYVAISGNETLEEAETHTITYRNSTENYTVVPGVAGATNASGSFNARYKAGIYSGKEAIKVTASRPAASAKEPMHADSVEVPLTIKVPDFVNMPHDIGYEDSTPIYTFAYKGGCPHAPEARYATQLMYAKVVGLATIYKATYGAGLSYNDASLAYGGFFDNANRDVKCHQSHRRGIDIDINGLDLSKFDLREGTHSYDGEMVTGVRSLEFIANLLGMTRVEENPSIHFRSNEYFE